MVLNSFIPNGCNFVEAVQYPKLNYGASLTKPVKISVLRMSPVLFEAKNFYYRL